MDVKVTAILIFIIFSVFVPVSMISASIMLRGRTRRNRVRDAPYESAEASSGGGVSIMKEYLHYFSMFIAYELLVAIALVWVPVARVVSFGSSMAVLGLLGAGIVMEALVVLLAWKSG